MINQEKIDKQLARERAQVEFGVERYRTDVSRKPTAETSVGNALVGRSVAPLADALRDLIETVESGKAGRGRPAKAAQYILRMQPDAVAFIAARTILNAAVQGEKTVKTAMSISSLIEEAVNLDELREAAPKLLHHMGRQAEKWSTAHHRRSIMRTAVTVGGVVGLEWKEGDKLALGMKLIELFVEVTGLADNNLVREGRRTIYRLGVTPATQEWLAKMHGRCELLEPRYTPMIVPPKDWTNPVNGGYLTRDNRINIIGSMSSATRDDLFSMDLSKVYQAVNRAQSTGWKINSKVLSIVKQLWTEGSTLGGLPAQEALALEVRPADIPTDCKAEDLPEDQRARLKVWRARVTETHTQNAKLMSKRLSVASQLSMAGDVDGEDAIYFPHNLDFRGRIYSVVTGLSPQGNDLSKSLLQFSKGKPLGETGGYWLCVHIANLFGVDKVSFDDRVAWTQGNAEALLDSAMSPLDGDRFWETADEPFEALAACFEFAGFTIAGNDFVSHLPIAMDGTCSGLQHLSAMLRDTVGGSAVNLMPNAKPSDIYTQVATKVEEYLVDEAATSDCAAAWMGKVSRKIVKRPTMTFAYSVTARGMRDQILGEIAKQADGGHFLNGFTNYESAQYLSVLVEKAIRATVVRGAEAMDFLKQAAAPVAAADSPIIWSTQDGLPIYHRYVKTIGKKCKVWYNGQEMTVTLREEQKKQDKQKHVAAIAPNYVHSMDATHLRMVTNRVFNEGLTEIAVIHDSFGVHACDTDLLHYALRDEMNNLYGESQLESFRTQILELLPAESHDEVPPVPAMGNLDLNDIYEAEYFFG